MSAEVSIRQRNDLLAETEERVAEEEHVSHSVVADELRARRRPCRAYVSIREHTSAYVSGGRVCVS
jgi:hypothetical protein